MIHRPLCFVLAITACLFTPQAEAAATGGLATCPATSVSLGGLVGLSTRAAAFDTTNMIGQASWDLRAGRVFMHSNGWLSGVTVDALDNYDVAGVPPGTPVNVTAELTVDGAVWTDGCGGSGCGGMYQVVFVHGADVREVLHTDYMFSGRRDHHDVVQLPLTITAGQPELLEIRALGHRTPGGAHYSEASCALRFVDLAPGVVVTSCQGFSGTLVPVRGSSWGRIKSLYR